MVYEALTTWVARDRGSGYFNVYSGRYSGSAPLFGCALQSRGGQYEFGTASNLGLCAYCVAGAMALARRLLGRIATGL